MADRMPTREGFKREPIYPTAATVVWTAPATPILGNNNGVPAWYQQTALRCTPSDTLVGQVLNSDVYPAKIAPSNANKWVRLEAGVWLCHIQFIGSIAAGASAPKFSFALIDEPGDEAFFEVDTNNALTSSASIVTPLNFSSTGNLVLDVPEDVRLVVRERDGAATADITLDNITTYFERIAQRAY